MPPALQVAQDVDLISVRYGSYSGGVITRGISVVGDGGTWLRPMPSGEALVVTGLRQGQTASIRRFANDRNSAPSVFIAVRNNAGSVHIDDVGVRLWRSSPPFIGIEISDCAHVTLTSTTIHPGGAPLVVRRSNVALSGCCLFSTNGQPAIYARESYLVLGAGTVDGLSLGQSPPNAPNIVELSARTWLEEAQPNVPAITGSGSAIEVDPAAKLATGIAPGHIVIQRHIATLAADTAKTRAEGEPDPDRRAEALERACQGYRQSLATWRRLAKRGAAAPRAEAAVSDLQSRLAGCEARLRELDRSPRDG